MRRFPALGLALSPALNAADPPALGSLAHATLAAAGQLGRQASTLGTVAAALASNQWQGAGGARFAQAAHEQVRRVRVAADLLVQLAEVVAGLGSALQRARVDAVDAVVHGAQLDIQAAELNRRTQLQHALLPQDPDSLLLPSGEAADLQARMRQVSDALERAEQSARSAWSRARAGIDLIAYATPVVRRRMDAQAWDPAASVRLVASAAAGRTACGPMDELGLPVGGVLTGPDGRDYGLVVQTARGADGRLLVTSLDQPQTRAGWHELAVRYGTTSFGRKAQTWEKVAVALGGAAGMNYPQGSSFAPELLGRLQLLPGGGAYVPEMITPAQDPVKEASAEAPRGKDPARYWVAPAGGLAGGRWAAVPDAIGLVNGGLSGFLLATHLDDPRSAAYRVVFEENRTGARRARVELFRVLKAPDGAARTVASGGYVDASGELAAIPVTGEAPDRHPVMTAAGH